jgi:hypothetical protein
MTGSSALRRSMATTNPIFSALRVAARVPDFNAFPKTERGTELMTGAAGLVEARQLRALHIRAAERGASRDQDVRA